MLTLLGPKCRLILDGVLLIQLLKANQMHKLPRKEANVILMQQSLISISCASSSTRKSPALQSHNGMLRYTTTRTQIIRQFSNAPPANKIVVMSDIRATSTRTTSYVPIVSLKANLPPTLGRANLYVWRSLNQKRAWRMIGLRKKP